MTDPTQRFSNRVADYVKFRPSYPDDAIACLVRETGLSRTSLIADIGSGTGLFTRLLLKRGLSVIGVEPNAAMRQAAEAYLASYDNFTSQAARAESTGLPPQSVDMITAAQAFHWFNNPEALAEFKRILKPGGWLALIWNQRQVQHPFQQAYEALLRRFATDYQQVNHQNITPEDIAANFHDGQVNTHSFTYTQRFDFNGLLGRMRSSSYCPHATSPDYPAMVDALHQVFDKHAQDGTVSFDYVTRLYLGHLAD